MTTNSKQKNIIVIAGPTGSGKTDLAVELALHYGAPVLSADSRQLYKGMPVGTAQPSPEQQRLVKHYFIASHEPRDEFTAGRYEREALGVLDEVFAEHDIAIVAGGSGLYIDALCEGFDRMPEVDPHIRKRLGERHLAEGLDALSEELKGLDPTYHGQVDLSNPQRVIRALEICIGTGQSYSSLRKGSVTRRAFGIVKLGTILPRETLYKRIERRVDAMMDAGLEEEARKLYPLRHLNALQTVGYKELFDYFGGNTDRDRAVELIKRNSRRYAKRQLTWFGRDGSIKWFSPYGALEAIRYTESVLTKENH